LAGYCYYIAPRSLSKIVNVLNKKGYVVNKDWSGGATSNDQGSYTKVNVARQVFLKTEQNGIFIPFNDLHFFPIPFYGKGWDTRRALRIFLSQNLEDSFQKTVCVAGNTCHR
jgi:hypothetical protein